MAKGTKKGSKPARVKERQERRFIPRPTTPPSVANAFGAVGALALGAGTFAQFGHDWMDNGLPPYPFAPALIAGGAVAFGAAVWFGTSGEAVLRVGAGGLAIEKGKELTRLPWYGIERVVWEPEAQVLAVQGVDETGREQKLRLPVKAQPAAVAWLVKEGRARIPDKVDVPDDANGLPMANLVDGELLVMDAVQVVGRRCAATQRIIAYEPDARVCPRCERVYYKLAVPETCACGASLEGLRATDEAVPA
jgi:hypothetical protein